MNIFKKAAVFLLISFAIGLILHSVFLSIYIVAHSGGIDLRSRVVGARLQAMGLNPYAFIWQQGMSDKLLDLKTFEKIGLKEAKWFNRTTLPPHGLFFFQVFNDFNYSVTMYIWLFFEWLMVFMLGYMMQFLFLDKKRYWLFFIVFISIFTHLPQWLLHIDRGQIYIFYAFFLCGAVVFLNTAYAHLPRNMQSYYISLTFMVIALIFWPLFGLVLIPLFFSLQHRKYALLAAILAITFWAGAFFLNKDMYASFFEKMLNGKSFVITTIPDVHYVEGVDISKIYYDNHADLRVAKFKKTEVYIRWLSFYVPILLGLAVFFVKKRIYQDVYPNRLFIFGYLVYILLTFLLYRPNYSYKAVQWIFPLFVIIAMDLYSSSFMEKKMLISLFFVLLGGALSFFTIINEDGRNMALFLGEISFICACFFSLMSSKKALAKF